MNNTTERWATDMNRQLKEEPQKISKHMKIVQFQFY